jgi:twitching motility protein PilT
MVHELLKDAVLSAASDLYLASASPAGFRVDGDVSFKGEAWSLGDVERMLGQLATQDQLRVVRDVGQIDISVQVPGVGRFRANLYLKNGGLAAAFRPMPTRSPTLEEVGAPAVAEDLLELPHGLCLVTGPVGQGKTSLLAAMIDYLNKNRALHIVTVEDPIEIEHRNIKSLISQREVGRDTRSYRSGLESALRQGCDVLMLGELRDPETIRLACTAAETGLCVVGTMHTSSAPNTVDRVIDAFPEAEKSFARGMLASVLNWVISPRLLKRLDEPGRVAVHEVMLSHPAVGAMIRDGKTAQLNTIIQTNRDIGMVTLDQSLMEMVASGQIARSEAARVSANKDQFTR